LPCQPAGGKKRGVHKPGLISILKIIGLPPKNAGNELGYGPFSSCLAVLGIMIIPSHFFHWGVYTFSLDWFMRMDICFLDMIDFSQPSIRIPYIIPKPNFELCQWSPRNIKPSNGSELKPFVYFGGFI
jgi:hypothetical protein